MIFHFVGLPRSNIELSEDDQETIRQRHLEDSISAVAQGSGGHFIDDGEVPSTSRGRPKKTVVKVVRPKAKPAPKQQVKGKGRFIKYPSIT